MTPYLCRRDLFLGPRVWHSGSSPESHRPHTHVIPDPDTVRRLHDTLLAHYDRDRRDLPWRVNRTPYRVWVSEIMLQQTRVETVVPYYGAWMERYPDVAVLAEADEEEVLKSWEGLGYYSRARNLHRAARLVRESHGGSFPDSAEGLRALPGIGEYTAGAVASLAFGKAVPAVDGNVRRVLSRLFDLEGPTPAVLREAAAALVHPERPGEWNEALMEFGATVCTPRSPACGECPLSDECRALGAGTVGLRPPPRRKTKVREADFHVVVPVRDDGALYLVRRPSEGLLGGLWEFPQAEAREGAPKLGPATEYHLELLGKPREMEAVPHVFSHLKATYRPVRIPASGGRESATAGWFLPDEARALALPVAQQKILDSAVSE